VPKVSRSLWLVVVTLVSPMLQAQSECDVLLHQGIYDYYRESNQNASQAQAQRDLCKAYSEYVSRGSSASASGSYGLGSASGSLSSSEVKAIGESMCDNSRSASAASALATNARSLINANVLTAFNECRSMENNLKVKTDFRDDASVGGVGFLGLTLSYANVGTNRPTIDGISVSPPGAFTCTGTLAQRANGKRFNEDALSLNCVRKVARTAFKLTNDPNAGAVYATEATVTIETGAGPVRRHVAAIFPKPTPVPTKEPVGGVVAFAGDLSTAPPPSGWLLCDGRALKSSDFPELFVVLGTTYGTGVDATGAQIGDFSLPDYRGLFLRGLDSRANPSPKDQDRLAGGAGLGKLQDDESESHSHTPTVSGQLLVAGVAGATLTPGYQNGVYYGSIMPSNLSSWGGTETRPKNLAVNYLIRAR